MRPVIKSAFGKVMKGLAYYSETGKAVDENLPSDDSLQKLIKA